MIPLPSAFLTTPLAHRGLHDRNAGVIENSRSAIAAAVAAGYGVEIDLQMSSDGEAMVFHDDLLDRLTAETGRVDRLSAAALGQVELTGGGECIPTLLDVLAIIGGKCPVLVEIKDQSGCLGEVDGRLERRAADILKTYEGPAALMSFNPCSVAVCAEAAPEIPRGRVSGLFMPEGWENLTPERAVELNRFDDLDSLGACFISHDHKDLSNPEVEAARRSGRHILCWTTKSPAEDKAARQIAENVTFENYAA